MKIFRMIIATTLCLVFIISFQNCAKTGFTEANSATPILEPVATSSANPNPTPAPEQCSLKGYVFSTGSPTVPYIHYRKCDSEIESWRAFGQHQCCSGQVSIIDTQVYPDSLCGDGIFEGIMTCL